MSTQQLGRLAFREEGSLWNAYLAGAEGLEGAILLCSIRMRLVQRPDRKKAFMALARECLADMIEDVTGTRPTWSEPIPAPTNERTKRA